MKNRLVDVLFKVGIFLLPYDAIHYLIPSSYAPISIYPFFVLLIVMLLSNARFRLNGADRILCLFFVYCVSISLITTSIYASEFRKYAEFVVTISIGIMVYFSIRLYLQRYAVCERGNFFRTIIIVIGKAYYFPLVVGIAEVLAIYHYLPPAVVTVINTVFGGWQTERPCLTTFEASWASMHLLIAMSVYYILYRINYKKRRQLFCLCVSAVLFVFCASAQGVLTAVFAAIVFLCLVAYIDKNVLYALRKLLPVSAVIVVILASFYIWLTKHPNTYMAARVLNFTSIAMTFRSDSSVVIRVGLPLINLLMFKDYFFFGVGGGNFRERCLPYLKKYFPDSLDLPEIRSVIRANDIYSAGTIYLSVLSEFGIFGAGFFYIFICRCIKRIRKMRNDFDWKYYTLLIAVLISLPIQFSSWAFVPFWLAMAMINSVVDDK